VLDELGRLFELQHRLWRRFLAKIALPVLQYILAVAVLALVRYITNMLSARSGTPGIFTGDVNIMLVLGYGIPLALVAFYFFIVKPLGGKRMWHEALLRIPLLGRVAQSLALARFSLVLHLMYEAGFPIEEALVRSFHATGNGAFAARGPAVAEAVLAGATLTEALVASRLFPNEYLEVLSVAEESGTVSERLEWLAGNYAERAEAAMGVLVTALACLIWACVAAFIIYFIITFFIKYVSEINGAMG
jgi:type IV pilus assembly protein PilC